MTRVFNRFRALAVDYDDTLATGGKVDATVLNALQRLKDSGRRLLLVTGRELDDLRDVCPAIGIFDRVVAENGGVLHRPETGDTRALCEPPSERFLELLRGRDVVPLSIGRVIVATREPQELRVLEAIRELGLELEIIFNKGAVMILPSGVNKATGLRHALSELKLQPARVVAVGDAENDHAFLEACGCGVAVANAIPALKERAGLVTTGAAGAGVVEVIDRLLAGSFPSASDKP
jgi:hydroxymethylpyrimidine pyrophosphatase-like HAD family hydrolase